MKSRRKFNPTPQQRKVMNHEINKYVIEVNERFQLDFDSMLLWYMHVHLGFGKKRLKRFYEGFQKEYERLITHYQLPGDTGWLCRHKLKEMGVDVEAWDKEMKERKNGR